jgi:hypothetical protein
MFTSPTLYIRTTSVYVLVSFIVNNIVYIIKLGLLFLLQNRKRKIMYPRFRVYRNEDETFSKISILM